MFPLEQIKSQIEQSVPGARMEIVPNPSVPAQSSLLLDPMHGGAIANFLRTASELRFDYASNVTGVDWPDRVEKIKTKVKKVVDCVEKEVEETTDKPIAGFLEAVYHL